MGPFRKYLIRHGNITDLPQIVDIYNQAIRSGVATGDLEEFDTKERIPWFEQFNETYPLYVIEVRGEIAGYCTLTPYRPGRRAMKSIAEISFFLYNKFQGMGIGSFLIKYMIEDCRRIGKKTLLAFLLDINEKSIGILKKFGFEQWGYFPDIIELNHTSCGQLIFGLKI
jgi:L-amino acid N-acyltransferase YncA